MKDRVFSFQGLNFKTELRLALLLIIPGLCTMLGILFGGDLLFPNIHFLKSVAFASIMTIGVCMITLRQLSRLVKEKTWIINIKDNQFHITFRNLDYQFHASEIKMIKNLGNIGLRYLTIKTADNIIKIRVGDTGLAPFSSQKDIDELDAFVQYIKPYINKNFNKKELRNIINTTIIPNFGVYVVKGEKIKYSIINKMKPWQVIIFILGIAGGVMILLMTCFIYYIDHK
ncbi:hypothetical protein [Chryseobacterium jejuense]|uniref:Uncharacterized protein n=1 Tax=Chryseobacterium jejuense TaxID=445960 RepID=A0A2X2WTU3_CHRJE|nr:hypothetical protein [Chryseobacterium jejuense]SDJ91763.1 hypothetical protein SAMN05421542_4666 [Chryseobacterium jejuense]SQB42977.1 Uncharacterised protein [Chryseobacterium jejuense]